MLQPRSTQSSHDNNGSFPLNPLRVILLVISIVAVFNVAFNMLHLHGIQSGRSGDDKLNDLMLMLPNFVNTLCTNQTEKTTSRTPNVIVAYAVSITGFNVNDQTTLMDRAAVLHQSIKLATQKSIKFPEYHIYAFVHPDAVECVPLLTRLGYRVQIHDTPFNVTDIPNDELKLAQENGCCGEKEYLKLYSYLLFDYPVVVHLDLDCIVLRPMDDVFSVLSDPTYDASTFTTESTMWGKDAPHRIPKNKDINFLFTRDYNMIEPGRKMVHQVGVQGGFLIVRPNQRDFDRMIEIILGGGDGFTIGDGWGGSTLAYGGYYGAGTIQGLASFYYGHHEQLNRSVELNRCYYNTMVDDPYGEKERICKTSEETCQNCRFTPIKDIYTAHFTTCGKPDWCSVLEPSSKEDGILCMDLFRAWHKTRLSLEEEWMVRFPGYDPQLHLVNASDSHHAYLLSYFQGHCQDGRGYLPMVFPETIPTYSPLAFSKTLLIG
jgi:hypothetical protein